MRPLAREPVGDRDRPVRERDVEDWRLHPEVVRSLALELVGRDSFDVDLFATADNAHCTVYYTKDNSAFDHLWLNSAFYGNPPFEDPELICAAFAKAVHGWERRPMHTSFTFVLPRWTTTSWWPSCCVHSARFSIVREFPTGSDLFTAPVAGGPERRSLGVTRWPVVVFHLARSLATVTDVSRDLLAHIRLGHPGGHVVPLLLDHGSAPGVQLGPASRSAAAAVSNACPVCRVAKAVRPPARPTGRQSSVNPFELLFMDTAGPYLTGTDGSQYAHGAVDDCTGWLITVPERSRRGECAAHALQCILDSIAVVAASAGVVVGGEGVHRTAVKTIQTDNAAEYTGGPFPKLCAKYNIAQRFTSAYLHQNNSIIEGTWRDVQNGTRALLLGAKLAKNLWPHAMAHYTFLRNRTPKTGRLQGASPYRVLFLQQPDLSRLKAFGCKAYQYLDYQQRSEDVPTESPPNTNVDELEEIEEFDSEASKLVSRQRLKLSNRAASMIYIGQCENSTAYKLLDPKHPQQKVRLSGMVVFDESNIMLQTNELDASVPAETHFHSDFNMEAPSGPMLESGQLNGTPFTVIYHRAYHHKEDNEIYAIFYVKCESHPNGIWASAEHLLRDQPNNCKTVEDYLHNALLPGHINPYYPLFVLCEVSTAALDSSSKHHMSQDNESDTHTKCLVIGMDLSTSVECNIQITVLDRFAECIDVPRHTLRTVKSPKIALAATISEHAASQTITEPKTIRQVQRAPDRKEWEEAMQKELDSLHSKGTFKFINKVPPGRKAILTAFKFKLKWKKNGELERRKARLIAHGQNQAYGVDYTETFAPSSQLTSVNLLLILAINLDLKVYHVDVVTAFLNAKLDAEVYLSLPDGRIAQAVKSIYGLKQAARDWNQLSDRVLMDVPGMKRSEVETCWYYLIQDDLIVYILVHVDDYMIATNSPSWKEEFINYFQGHFEINDLGTLDQVVGIGVTWGNQSVALSRERAIKQTIQHFRMDGAKQVCYPIESGFSMTAAPKLDTTLPYLNLLGELRYHQRSVRPDISTALAYLSRFSSSYDKKHFDALKRVLRYLIGTADMPLILTKGPNRQLGVFDLTMFTDATWADCKESKQSTSGWAIFVNSSPALWTSSKQKCVALSSTEAEIIALSDGCRDLMYLKQMLEAFVKVETPMVVFVDNQATIALMQQPVNNGRTKHIPVRHFWVRDLVQRREIVLRYVPTEHNVADFLTKPLQGARFREFRSQLMGMH